MTAHLFSPLRQRDVTLRNRVVLSPMCQYACHDGLANDWHLMHLGSRAAGGVAAVITEATAVLPEGRISQADLGLWDDSQVAPLARVLAFVAQQGAVPGIQLAHAGRKASTRAPWLGRGPLPVAEGGWTEIHAPSPVAFDAQHPTPRELDGAGLRRVVAAFAAAARRARGAGARIAEIHAAHGYLLHQFLSPLSNRRRDEYGGSFANRTRLLREVTAAVRDEWPERDPLWVRISATDWVEGGWTPDEAVALARDLAALGVDLIDCSSGGSTPDAKVPVAPGYQVPFAARVRAEARVASGAVGLITEPGQADAVVRSGQADVVLLGRVLLRQPHWVLQSAQTLGQSAPIPERYQRAY